MKELLGQALGPDFEVIRLAGKGRKAEVYLAREILLDRLVAVKILPPEGLNLYDILYYDELFITQPCLDKVQRRFLA